MRFADHPTALSDPSTGLVAIAWNGWSQSFGMAGRDQSESVVAITRCAQSGRRKACGAVEQRKVTDENSGCDRQLATGYCPAEEIELAGIVVRLGGDRLVVTTYLGVMVCLEFEGELHECVGNVSGDFIGNGELVGLFCAGFARH